MWFDQTGEMTWSMGGRGEDDGAEREGRLDVLQKRRP